jgi:uncharacterized protein (DUF2267 family)
VAEVFQALKREVSPEEQEDLAVVLRVEQEDLEEEVRSVTGKKS